MTCTAKPHSLISSCSCPRYPQCPLSNGRPAVHIPKNMITALILRRAADDSIRRTAHRCTELQVVKGIMPACIPSSAVASVATPDALHSAMVHRQECILLEHAHHVGEPVLTPHTPCGWAAGPVCWLDALADASLPLLPPLACCCTSEAGTSHCQESCTPHADRRGSLASPSSLRVQDQTRSLTLDCNADARA